METQLVAIAATRTHAKMNNKDEANKLAAEIVKDVLSRTSEYQEAYGIVDLMDLIEEVAKRTVA